MPGNIKLTNNVRACSHVGAAAVNPGDSPGEMDTQESDQSDRVHLRESTRRTLVKANLSKVYKTRDRVVNRPSFKFKWRIELDSEGSSRIVSYMRCRY